jgi:branched-chain amino acid transport system ATP-binding protein
MTVLLEVHHLAADIGQFHILHDISFQVLHNEVTVLLGRNGVGKTTTMRTLMGFLPVTSGQITFSGTSLMGVATHQRRRCGIAYVPEDANLFPSLTFEENLRLAVGKPNSGASAILERVVGYFPDLKAAWRRTGGTLSGGQRQMLAVASALVQEPTCLLIDEPSKGLSPLFVERLAEVMESLRSQTTILLVEQNFYLASRVGQRFVLIDDGRTVATGLMEELIASDTLKQRYLGVRVSGRGDSA